MPFELVHEAFLTPDRLDRVQAAHPGRRGRALRRAVRGDPRLRRARRQPARDVRDARSTTRSGSRARRLRPRRRVRRVVRRPHRRADAELVSDARDRSGDRPAPSDPRRASTTRPRIINGVFRVDVRPTRRFPSPLTLIPTYPDLPMEDVYPRVPHTDTRELYLRDGRRQPRRLLPVGHRPHVLGGHVASITDGCCENAIAWATERAAAGRGRGPGRARRRPSGGSASR